jgi:hypothetical protein
MKKIVALSCLAFFSLSCHSYAMTASVHAHSFNTKGMTAHNIPFHSLHTVTFVNDTDTVQNINVFYKACAQFQDCVTKSFPVAVAPHTTWNDKFEFRKIFVYNRLGRYRSSADTSIDGPIQRMEHSEAKIEVEDR